jgi:hypothetical protein
MLAELSLGWATFPIVLTLAILVYWYGNFRVQRQMSARNTEPRGRRGVRSQLKADPQFSAMVGRMLQRGLATPIAEAPEGPVLVRGVLAAADSHLGGAAGRECVWKNRSGAPRDTAVAAEYVTVADASGRATIENLALADVVAPEDKLGPHRASCALHLGDEVEVVARFKLERYGQDLDPTRLVYGTLGADGNLHIRVCKRDPAPPARDDLPEAAPASSSQPSPSGTTTS